MLFKEIIAAYSNIQSSQIQIAELLIFKTGGSCSYHSALLGKLILEKHFA
jgi:hypothetical protein